MHAAILYLHVNTEDIIESCLTRIADLHQISTDVKIHGNIYIFTIEHCRQSTTG